MKKFNLAPVPTFAGGSIEMLLERWLPDLWKSIQNSYNIAPNSPPSSVAVGASPVTLTAADPGFYVITGGAVTMLSLTRQGLTVNLPTTLVQVVVSAGDTLTITYTSAPTVTFWPFYGS